jgi:hypothetical protein
MTLSEIETILEELSKRHPDLSKEMLTTMLLSAGWEDKLIKDALVLFNQKHPELSHKNNSTTKTAPLNNGAVSTVPLSEVKDKHPITELGGERTILESSSALNSNSSARVVRNQNDGGWLFRLFGITFKEVQQPAKPPLVHEVKAAVVQTPPPPQTLPPEVHQLPSPVPVTQKEEVPTPLPPQVILPVPSLPVEKIEAPVLVSKPQVVIPPPSAPLVTPPQNPPIINQVQNVTQKKEEGGWLFRLFGITFKEDKGAAHTPSRQVTFLPAEKTSPAPVQAPVSVPAPAPAPPQVLPKVILVETPASNPPLPQPEKNITVEIPAAPLTVQEIHSAPVVPSLIIREEVRPLSRDIDKEALLPPNLPLVPFESSPHVWSFSEYKDTYHKDLPVSNQESSVENSKEVHVQKVDQKVEEDEEILLEKTPMTKGDESLVFLASMMLFVIILILGYMYSNGRL